PQKQDAGTGRNRDPDLVVDLKTAAAHEYFLTHKDLNQVLEPSDLLFIKRSHIGNVFLKDRFPRVGKGTLKDLVALPPKPPSKHHLVLARDWPEGAGTFNWNPENVPVRLRHQGKKG